MTIPPAVQPQVPSVADFGDGFDLSIEVVELTDAGSMVNVTSDGCGSTCGACPTGSA